MFQQMNSLFNSIVQDLARLQINSDGLRKRIAVGEVDQAESDQINEEMFGAKSPANLVLADAFLNDLAQDAQNRRFRDLAHGPNQMPAF